eukprot:GDKI01020267.1.p1 GENE.GDKI01020267.1~~GDKI01020267.1.p1  ORF type:complete len:122 (+),score=4.21 GDKI01020267.1:82-447(+)
MLSIRYNKHTNKQTHKASETKHPKKPQKSLPMGVEALSLSAHKDLIDGDEDELDGVANHAHDSEANGAGDSNLLELLSIGLGAAPHQTHRVHGELLGGGNHLAHGVALVHEERRDLGGGHF